MKIKIFFFILPLLLCSYVEFYPWVIHKYSDEVFLYPHIETIGFILDISEFQDNEKIFIKITMNEYDANRNLIYYCIFSNDYSSSMDESDLMNPKVANRKNVEVTKGNRKTYYFEILKIEGVSYLYFIIDSSYFFTDKIGFKNTKSDESKKAEKTVIIIVVVFVCVFVLIIVGVIIECCVKSRKMKGLSKQEEVIVGAQLYNQQQMNNMYYQQPMYGQPQYYVQPYGQPQYYGQPQQGQMIVYSQGTNPQVNSPNPIETNQGVVSSNQNNDGGIKDV